MFTKTFLIDLAERTIATYLQVLIGLLIVGWVDVTSAADALDLGTSALIAAAPAALAVAKGALASRHGDPESAALTLPPIRR